MANRTNYEINGNKYWRIKRVIGHSPDGKPIHKYFYGVNRKDALNKYDEWKNEKDNIYTNNDVPFSDLADYYAENVLSVNSSYTQNTIDKYLYHYNRFVMGHKSVDVTAKYYASVSLDEKKHAMDMLPDYGKKC